MKTLHIRIIFTTCISAWSCAVLFAQNPTGARVKNKSLPPEITLSPKTVKIIDSVFTFSKSVRKLQSVQTYVLKQGILVSGNRQYYVNDTLNQTTDEKYDENGNNIESNTFIHPRKSRQVNQRTLDRFGNIILLRSTEDNKTTVIEYQNKYKDNRLVAVSKISRQSGNAIEKVTFQYDPKGNLVEEWVVNSFLNARNIYQYNKSNQVSMYRHVRNGVLNDSVSYHYKGSRLIKEEWYQGLSKNPMVKKYHYNEKGALTLIQEDDGYRTEYKNFDDLLNWQLRETYAYGSLSSVTKRHFINQ